MRSGGPRCGDVRRRFAAAVGVMSVAGCSAVLGIDADRSLAGHPSDASAGDASAGDAGAGAWGCLGAPREELNPNEHVDLTLLVMDAVQASTAAGAIDGGSDLDTVSGAWLPGVAVRACALRDLDCDSGTTPMVTTDDGGAATFHLMEDFAGFFDMRRSDLVPATLYPGQFLIGQSIASFPAYEISPAGLRELASSITSESLGLDPSGSLGHALVTVYDCLDHQASGVTVAYSASGASTVPFYFQGGLPSATATSTDAYGLAGAVNVPTGAMTVTASLPATKTPVGMTAFLVRPGALTFAWIRARTH
jgi:hypothetical protein